MIELVKTRPNTSRASRFSLASRMAATGLAVLLSLTVSVRAGEAASTLPKGVAMIMDTTDLASLERAIMFFTNAAMPGNTGLGAGSFDQTFRMLQKSGQMPSLINPLIQQFFGLPGVGMHPDRGISAALFIPGESEAEGESSLAFAAWLPVRSYAELMAGVAAGRREWSHIRAVPDLPNVLAINYNRYGASTLYMSPAANGAVVSTTLWGLTRAQRHWRGGPGGVPGATGFTARIVMDFLQPGVEPGLVALLEGPAKTMMRRMQQSGRKMVADFTLYGLLHAMRQSTSLDARLDVGANGDVGMNVNLVAKPVSELSVFLGDTANRTLSPRLLTAIPGHQSVALTLASGKGLKELLRDFIRDTRNNMAAAGKKDSLTRRIGDILQGIEIMSAAAAGDIAAAITLEGAGMALFDAGNTGVAGTLAGSLGGGDAIAVRAQGNDVVVAVGLEATKNAENAAANLVSADGEKTLRPELTQLFTELGGQGIFAFACYPSEMVRLILSYKAKEAYLADSDSRDRSNPMDMFALAVLGNLVRNAENAAPSSYPLTIAADAPRPDLLRVRAGLSLRVMSEIMATYQRIIIGFTPGAEAMWGKGQQ